MSRELNKSLGITDQFSTFTSNVSMTGFLISSLWNM